MPYGSASFFSSRTWEDRLQTEAGLLLYNSKAFNLQKFAWEEKAFYLKKPKQKPQTKKHHHLPDFKVRATTFVLRALGQKVVVSEWSYQTWAFSFSLGGEFDEACKSEQLCRC